MVEKIKYSEFLKIAKSGDVIGTAGNTFFGHFIRFWTREPISHVGILSKVKFNGMEPMLCTLESIEGAGVRLVPFHLYVKKYHWNTKTPCRWYQLDSSINGPKLVEECLRYWYDGYATNRQFVIIGIPLLQKIRRLLGKPIDVSKNRWHCAELLANAFKEVGYEIQKEPVLHTPWDITQFSCLGPEFQIVEG